MSLKMYLLDDNRCVIGEESEDKKYLNNAMFLIAVKDNEGMLIPIPVGFPYVDVFVNVYIDGIRNKIFTELPVSTKMENLYIEAKAKFSGIIIKKNVIVE